MRSNVSKINPECPAISELANTLEKRFPEITLLTTNNVSPGTRHTSGLAIDIMLDSTKAAQRQRAEGLIAAFIKVEAKMLWSDLIYTDYHIPTGRGGYGGTRLKPNAYTADRRHFDHIHMDWVDFSLKNSGAEYQRIPYKWSASARTTGFAGALDAELAVLAGGGAASVVPPAAMGWIDGWWKVVQDGIVYYYHFRSADGSAAWTYVQPASGISPRPSNPENRASFVSTQPDRVVITWDRWDAIATVETFRSTAPDNGSMSGTSNRGNPLTATKIG